MRCSVFQKYRVRIAFHYDFKSSYIELFLCTFLINRWCVLAPTPAAVLTIYGKKLKVGLVMIFTKKTTGHVVILVTSMVTVLWLPENGSKRKPFDLVYGAISILHLFKSISRAKFNFTLCQKVEKMERSNFSDMLIHETECVKLIVW